MPSRRWWFRRLARGTVGRARCRCTQNWLQWCANGLAAGNRMSQSSHDSTRKRRTRWSNRNWEPKLVSNRNWCQFILPRCRPEPKLVSVHFTSLRSQPRGSDPFPRPIRCGSSWPRPRRGRPGGGSTRRVETRRVDPFPRARPLSSSRPGGSDPFPRAMRRTARDTDLVSRTDDLQALLAACLPPGQSLVTASLPVDPASRPI